MWLIWLRSMCPHARVQSLQDLSMFLARQWLVSWRPTFSPNYLWWLQDNEEEEEEEDLMRMQRIYKIMRIRRVMRMIRMKEEEDEQEEEEEVAYVINPQRRTDCFWTHISAWTWGEHVPSPCYPAQGHRDRALENSWHFSCYQPTFHFFRCFWGRWRRWAQRHLMCWWGWRAGYRWQILWS